MSVTISVFMTADAFHFAPCVEVWRDNMPSGTFVSFPRDASAVRIMDVAREYAAMHRDENGKPANILMRRFMAVDLNTMTAQLETFPA